MNQHERHTQTETDDNRTLALVLIGAGALFLLGHIFGFDLGAAVWPFFVIIPGLPFLYFAHQAGDCDTAGLIFPGVIITSTGLLLLYQSVTGHWESWAYAWALYPAMVGWAMQWFGQRTGRADERKTGREILRWGLIVFAGFAVVFEVFIFSGIALWMLALGLVAAGVLLLNNERGLLHNSADSLRVNIARVIDYGEEKPKRKNITVGSGTARHHPNGSAGPAPAIDPDLQRRIDAALAEDDDPKNPAS
ncbi:MAG: hypothetical protein ACOCYT_05580 [Chloroflexota bacterium]